jgi:uncharacterized repeat protein (TIGR04138 family)
MMRRRQAVEQQPMTTRQLYKLARESGYPIGAFLFVQRGLEYTVKQVHGPIDGDAEEPEPGTRHVSGQQLCEGMRSFAIEEYGSLARTVLKRWRIRSCQDFGKIVFAMVEAGYMHKTDDDSLEDFTGIYDFETAFDPSALMK